VTKLVVILVRKGNGVKLGSQFSAYLTFSIIRKKKCDEVKPKCADCRRLNLPCTRTVRTSLQKEPPPLYSAETHEDASGPLTTSPSTNENYVVTPSTESITIDIDVPVFGEVDQSFTDFDIALCSAKPVYQWLPDDTFQMLANGIKNFDVINDLDLEDGEPHVLAIDGVDVASSSYRGGKQISAPSNWLPLDPMNIPYNMTLSPLDQLTSQQDRLLFQHYTHIVSRSLCIASSDNENPFLKLMMPLASASSAVMGAVLALSAVHLKHNGGYPEIVQRGINHQTKGESNSAPLKLHTDEMEQL
jgi:transcriptional activator protein UGA3